MKLAQTPCHRKLHHSGFDYSCYTTWTINQRHCKDLLGEMLAPDMLVHVNIAKQNNERFIHIKHSQRLWTFEELTKTLPVLGLWFNWTTDNKPLLNAIYLLTVEITNWPCIIFEICSYFVLNSFTADYYSLKLHYIVTYNVVLWLRKCLA